MPAADRLIRPGGILRLRPYRIPKHKGRRPSIAANPPLVGSADVTISIDADNSNNSKLKGQYAFLLKGLNGDGNAALAGSFVADGNGNITSGTGNYVYSDSLESLSEFSLYRNLFGQL